MIEAKKQRQRAEKERIRKLEEKEDREAANYNPWGRGGCGTFTNTSFRVLAIVKTSNMRSSEVSIHNTTTFRRPH